MKITYEEWENKYEPLKNPLNSDAPYNGCMFETCGEELNYIKQSNIKPCFIWTLIDCENEEQYIVPGFHLVNRVGYFITWKYPENDDVEVNLNEMITVGAAKYACIEFLESLGIPEEQYEDLIHDFFNQKF